MKSMPDGVNSRLGDTEHVSDLEDRIREITQSEQQKEKQIVKNENSLRDFCDNVKCTNIHIIGDSRRRRERKGSKMYLIKLWLKTSQT